MFATIVAAIDSSTEAQSVIRYAGYLAQTCAGKVLVVHLREVYVANGSVTLGDVREDEHAASAIAAAAVAKLEMLQVVATAQVRTTTSDTVATDLLAIANDAQADLLVLGRHHHTRLSALFERPVEEDIIKDVSLPVLLVPSAPQ